MSVMVTPVLQFLVPEIKITPNLLLHLNNNELFLKKKILGVSMRIITRLFCFATQLHSSC